MSLMPRYPVSLSLVRKMATDAKYVHVVFEGCVLKILTKMSVLSVPHNLHEAEYNGKHAFINDELYLHKMHRRIPMVVTITMAVMTTAIIDFTVSSCSSFKSGRRAV